MNNQFSQLIGTLAVILVVAEFVSNSDLFSKVSQHPSASRRILLAAVIGGVFGIYANISGVPYAGAFITVRDTGPMLAGFLGGPASGFLAGIICGIHRYTMGGITAQSCIVATCSIGLFSGLYYERQNSEERKLVTALKIGVCMEMFHLLMVLLMVKPFETAWGIVKAIAIPFIVVNSIGFAIIVMVLDYLDRQKTLSEEKNKIDSELETARIMQHSLLPPITKDYPCQPANYVFDISTFIEPAKKVGGDFYDFFYIDKTHFAFLISDVSGKGIPAAMFMTAAKQALQTCLRDFKDPSEAVQRANETLYSNNESGMFVTSWIGILNIKTREVDYICAGHNPPLLIRDGQAEYIRGKSNFIIAGIEDVKYQPGKLQLKKDDVLYLYTDGVSEAADKDYQLYGEERLKKCLESLTKPKASEVITAVNEDINRFVAGWEQHDDITMLAISIEK